MKSFVVSKVPEWSLHTILVVEDQEDTREFYMTCLSLEGFAVRCAVDGADGIAQVRAYRPQLVVLDFTLPRLSGAEVLREIRRDPEINHTPVVLVSGQIQAFLAEVNELTFHTALEKPCEVNELVEAIRCALTTEAVGYGPEAICTKRPDAIRRAAKAACMPRRCFGGRAGPAQK
jgi:DNA-binding response OmpR family regulator